MTAEKPSNTSDTQLPYFDWSCRSEDRLTWEHFLHTLNLSRLKGMRALELGNHVRYIGERNVSDGIYKHTVHEKNDTKEVATKNEMNSCLDSDHQEAWLCTATKPTLRHIGLKKF